MTFKLMQVAPAEEIAVFPGLIKKTSFNIRVSERGASQKTSKNSTPGGSFTNELATSLTKQMVLYR